jgi:hypothetical protein
MIYNIIDMYDINNKVKIKSIVLSGINFDMHQLEWGDITTTNNNLVVSVGNGIMIIDHQTLEVVKKIDTDGICMIINTEYNSTIIHHHYIDIGYKATML